MFINKMQLFYIIITLYYRLGKFDVNLNDYMITFKYDSYILCPNIC